MHESYLFTGLGLLLDILPPLAMAGLLLSFFHRRHWYKEEEKRLKDQLAELENKRKEGENRV